MELILLRMSYMSKFAFLLPISHRNRAMPQPRLDRLQIMLTTDEFRMLDDWRFAHRMPSRSAAVRELLKRGLASEGFLVSDGTTKSKDYSLGGNADGHASAGDPLPSKSPKKNGDGVRR